jgi:hypothetical protein
MHERIHENAVAFMRNDLPNKMTAPAAPIAEPAFPLRSGHTAESTFPNAPSGVYGGERNQSGWTGGTGRRAINHDDPRL